DAEASMLVQARASAAGAGLVGAALPRLPFPDARFDAAVANFVLNHVGDPAAALAELRRVVRPGGRVAVTLWPSPHPPLQRLWGEAIGAAGVTPPADLPRLAPGRDFPRTEAGVTGLLDAAGLTDAVCATVAWTHRTDPEDWWAGPAAGISAVGFVLQRQEPAVRDRIRREYDRLTAGLREADGRLALPTAALLGAASVA
ncbi:class I SAM-dependent methyltransferase, partial [Micromonospora maritima]